jgi:pimeloyl-ACP methyl ester carboxylesterase
MDYVKTADGTKLYVKIWGDGPRSVVMTHGWPLNADTWDEAAMTFAERGYKAIFYDRRGFGRSSQPWGGYDYDTFSDDLAAVMDATDAKDATLIGFSMGGGEVARYMSRHQGRNVVQAALVASVVPYLLKTDDHPQGVPQQVFGEMLANIRADRPAFFAQFFENFFGVGTPKNKVSPQTLEWAQMMALMAGSKPTLSCVNAFATTDFRPDLAAFDVPTLVIHGTGDAIVPIDTSARAAVKGIKDATLLEYDGGSHGLFATHKDQLVKDLLEFLERRPANA